MHYNNGFFFYQSLVYSIQVHMVSVTSSFVHDSNCFMSMCNKAGNKIQHSRIYSPAVSGAFS